MVLILSIKDTAVAAIRSLCALLCEAIYPVISYAYNLFIQLATFRLFDVAKVTKIYERVTMILTIVMVFYITFEFVKYIIQPDAMTDKEKGITKLPLRMIAVVVLIAFVPHMFEYANKLQDALIKNEVVTKVILQKSYSSNGYDKLGRSFAWNTLELFYNVSDNGAEEDCDGIPCGEIILMNNSDMSNNGTLRYMTLGINSTGEIEEEIGNTGKTQLIEGTIIHFDAIWAVLVGGVIAYMLIIYCIDVAARVVQIAYLQLIAPIPIVGILSPKKDNMFTKWAKQCGITYLDVFIRLVIINFVLLICDVLIYSDELSSERYADSGKIVKIALILGLLVFAKRVPKMISELLPKSSSAASGNFGLKPGDRNLGRVIGSALGLASGAAVGAASGLGQGLRAAKSVEGKGRKVLAGLTGGAWGATRGFLGGAGRGLVNGAKKGSITKNVSTGVKNQLKSNQTFGNKAEAGYTIGHQFEDKVGGVFGASRIEQHEKAKVPLERLTKTGEKAQNTLKAMTDDDKLTKAMNGKFSGNAIMDRRVKKLNDTRQRLKDLQTPDSEASKEYRVGARRQDTARIEQAHRRIRDDKLSRVNADAAAYVNGLDEDNLRQKYGINRLTYTSQTEYDKAIENAKKKEAEEFSKKQKEDINKEYQDNVARDCVYKTEEEARTAMAEEIGKLQKEQHDQEDDVKRAYAYYATYLGQDDEDVRKLHMLQEEVRLYNERTQNPALRINMEEDINDAMYNKALELLNAYKGNEDRTNHDFDNMTPEQLLQTLHTQVEKPTNPNDHEAQARYEQYQQLIGSLYDNGLFVDYGEILDDWRKKTVPKKYTEQAQMQILRENEAIDRIKSETSGSSNKS